MKVKTIAMIMATVMMVVCMVSGTLAWLTATSDEVKNTFTTSTIKVQLAETKTDFKMVPGHEIAKDPKATVLAGSEECWLYVKLEKSTNFDSYLTYEMADGWTLVSGETNVYARKVESANIGTSYSVLKGDKVTVKTDVTKTMMETAETSKPTLTITAYASQLNKNATEEFTAAEAWANITSTTSPDPEPEGPVVDPEPTDPDPEETPTT